MNKDERKLPKWAQAELDCLRSDLIYQRERYDRLQMAHSLTEQGREWFTLPGPVLREGEYGLGLFFLSRDGAHRACTLYEGDVLLIGRKRK